MMKSLKALIFVAISLWAYASARADELLNLGIERAPGPAYGGYFQAAAAGYYRKRGLNVIIRTQIEPGAALQSGSQDVVLADSSFAVLGFLQQKMPVRAIAAIYQRATNVLIAHPGVDHDSFPQLRAVPIMLAPQDRVEWWPYLRAHFGYLDSQIRPYEPQEFLVNMKAVRSGRIDDAPAGTNVLLLADAGFQGYGQILVARQPMITHRGDLLQRFVDATAEGWYSFLYGDSRPADSLIRKLNPQTSDIEAGRALIKSAGLIDSGDAERSGIGAMTAKRWAGFFRDALDQRVYPPDLDIAQAYTLAFVNKGAGLAIKRRQ